MWDMAMYWRGWFECGICSNTVSTAATDPAVNSQPSSSRGSAVHLGSLPERQTWISSSLEVTRLPWLQKFKHPDVWTFVPSLQSHCWRSDDEMDPCSLFLCITVPYFCYPESGGFDWTLIGCFLLQSQGDDWLLSPSLSLPAPFSLLPLIICWKFVQRCSKSATRRASK